MGATTIETREVDGAVERIEQETSQWRDRLTGLEAELETAKARLAEVQGKRDELLLSNLENGAAKGKLNEARADLREAQNGVEEASVSIVKVQEKLSDLGKALTLATRHAKEKQRAELSREQAALAAELDALLVEVIEKCRDWLDLTARVYQCSTDLYVSPGRTPKRQLRDVIHGYFRPLDPYHFDRPVVGGTFAECSGRFAKRENIVKKEDGNGTAKTKVA